MSSRYRRKKKGRWRRSGIGIGSVVFMVKVRVGGVVRIGWW